MESGGLSRGAPLMESLGYAYEEIVNGGGQGLILKYRHIQTDTHVFVKMFMHRTTFAIEAGTYQRIQEECPDLRRFVVQIWDAQPYPPNAQLEDIVGEAASIVAAKIPDIKKGGGVLIMEWLANGDLSECDNFIRILQNREWLAQWNVFLQDCKKACLKYHFHHNDMKLRNIFFEIKSPAEVILKLGDFGHSKFPSPDIDAKELARFDSWIENEWNALIELTDFWIEQLESNDFTK